LNADGASLGRRALLKNKAKGHLSAMSHDTFFHVADYAKDILDKITFCLRRRKKEL
jgi:hypothetical protein